MSNIEIITENDITEDSLFYKKYWRRFLLGLLDVGSVHLHSHPHLELFEALADLKDDDISFEQSNDFLVKSKVRVEKSKVGSLYEREVSNKIKIQSVCNKALKELVSMHFVSQGTWAKARTIENFKYKNAICSYHLTEKGVDAALKLQEHDDSERRHKATLFYSKMAFSVSLVALGAVILSVCINYNRLYLYKDEIGKVTSNQAAILKKIKQPKIPKIKNATKLQSSVAQIKEKP